MRTRRGKKSDARQKENVGQLVASCVVDAKPYVSQALGFLLVSGVAAGLAVDRDSRSPALLEFSRRFDKINSILVNQGFDDLVAYVAGLPPESGISLACSLAGFETILCEFWNSFGGLGVAIGNHNVWHPSVRVYCLYLMKD